MIQYVNRILAKKGDYMSYLRMIKNKIQPMVETVASALNIEVVVADRNLTRIAGTGDFYNRVNENCSDDSLFAKVIESGESIINLSRKEHCKNCSKVEICSEFANMSYPIKNNLKIIGVVSFSSFDKEQTEIIKIKKYEYYNMLKQTAEMIEKDILNVQENNKLNRNITEVSDIINCINKGIIILNSKKQIIHINSTAIESLGIDLSDHKIIGANIKEFIEGISLNAIRSQDFVGIWKIKGDEIRVRYNVNKIHIENEKEEFSIMISFDELQKIINLAKTYENKDEILFENIIGNSEEIIAAINRAKIAAGTDSTILIQGDSGTGKELFARSIHNESSRKNGKFVAINCSSIPENLIESELFGYEKGSFTGANPGGKKGLIELANNGTLFLDEIGDLPPHLQTKFLRVLQERKIQKVGGNEPIDVNIRVIAATHRDLRQLVKSKEFRLDLYYRINVIPINLPSLKNRGHDVILCSEFIIQKMCKTMNKKTKRLSEDVIKRFKAYNWSGNIRELENVLEHGICFSEDEYIKTKDLPEYFFQESLIMPSNNKLDYNKNLEELKSDYEKEIIKNFIDIYGNTLEGKKLAAEKLNIGLTTLYRKINNYEN